MTRKKLRGVLFQLSNFVYTYEVKYLSKINKLCKRAWKYGYTNKCICISDLIPDRDKQLWGKSYGYSAFERSSTK